MRWPDMSRIACLWRRIHSTRVAVWAFGAVVSAPTRGLPAQATRMAASVADSVAVSENVVRRLFRGISLDSDTRQAALAIARRSFVAQMDTLADNRANRIDPEPAARRLEVRRDRLLLALLRTDTARAMFERNRSRPR